MGLLEWLKALNFKALSSNASTGGKKSYKNFKKGQ
jgi:hypothetical protein